MIGCALKMAGNWLKEDKLETQWYIATFTGYGIKRQKAWTPKTIAIFTDLKIKNGDYITPRAWSNATKKLEKLNLNPYDKIKFQAKIQEHPLNRKKAYKITHIQKTAKIGHAKKNKKKEINYE